MLHAIGSIVRFFIRGTAAAALVGTLIYLLQDFQLFPAVIAGLAHRAGYASVELPDQVERFLVDTADGEQLEAWRVDVAPGEATRGVALLLHGGSGTNRDYLAWQLWLRDLHFRSYSFDYRGTGMSSGWPSEAGIYQDAEAVYRFVRDREPKDQPFLLAGASLGAAPAAALALDVRPEMLVLLSPFMSAEELMSSYPFLSYAAPLLRYHLPIGNLITSYTGRCAVIVGGRNDGSIPFAQSERVYRRIPGTVQRSLIVDETSGHDELFAANRERMTNAIAECFVSPPHR